MAPEANAPRRRRPERLPAPGPALPRPLSPLFTGQFGGRRGQRAVGEDRPVGAVAEGDPARQVLLARRVGGVDRHAPEGPESGEGLLGAVRVPGDVAAAGALTGAAHDAERRVGGDRPVRAEDPVAPEFHRSRQRQAREARSSPRRRDQLSVWSARMKAQQWVGRTEATTPSSVPLRRGPGLPDESPGSTFWYTGGVNPACALALVAGVDAAAVCVDTLSTGPFAAALMLRMRLVGPVE